MRTFNPLAVAISCAVALIPVTAVAQPRFPSKPVKLVLPYAGGSLNDLAFRIVGENLEKRWGQPLVVEPMPAGGGRLAFESTARATPDGYTIANIVSALTTMPYLQKDLGFDPQKDIVGITAILRYSPFIAISTSLPAKNLEEFVAYAKANPGKINYGTQGQGNFTHLMFEIFNASLGINTVAVHYKGTQAAHQSVLAGDTQLTGITKGLLAGMEGKVRLIATTDDVRSPDFPDVPTLKETGRFEFVPYSWIGVGAPAKVPGPIVEQLSRDIQAAVSDPEVSAKLIKTTSANRVLKMSSAEFNQLLRSEFTRWGEVTKRLGLTAQ
jgi:tripartite-type tricarboxylate transporter receptor subunit TctC